MKDFHRFIKYILHCLNSGKITLYFKPNLGYSFIVLCFSMMMELIISQVAKTQAVVIVGS